MIKKSYRQGELLFREGDPIEGVLRIVTGTVEVVRERHAAAIVLGTVGPGEVLGEMGVVERRAARSAAARAASDVEAELVAPAAFLEEISQSPEAARELIVRLSQRLHEAEDRIVGDEQPGGPRLPHERGLGAKSQVAPFTLAAASPELRRQIAHDLEITTVPFLVGRAPLDHESSAALKVDLRLEDREPLRLSRDHFAIVRREGRLYVRDLRSTLGTTVNGRPIGDHFDADEAPLRAGENEIIAGGVASPFVFSIRVDQASEERSEPAALAAG